MRLELFIQNAKRQEKEQGPEEGAQASSKKIRHEAQHYRRGQLIPPIRLPSEGIQLPALTPIPHRGFAIGALNESIRN
jgi:hypothetical protein